MVRVSINGLMENLMSDNMKMIKKMDLECLLGVMEKNMRVFIFIKY